MQDNKKINSSLKNNDSKNNLIGLAIFVGMFILIIIVIVILTRAILPGSGSSANSMLVADSNLGIHTDTTTQPITVKSQKKNSSYDNNGGNDDLNSNNSGNKKGTVMIVNSSVNVRSGPGSSYKQIGELATGREVTVLENVGGWYRISFNGSNDAYIYGSYVNGSLPESTSSSNAYNANTETSYTDYAQYGQNNNFNNTSYDNNEYYYN